MAAWRRLWWGPRCARVWGWLRVVAARGGGGKLCWPHGVKGFQQLGQEGTTPPTPGGAGPAERGVLAHHPLASDPFVKRVCPQPRLL